MPLTEEKVPMRQRFGALFLATLLSAFCSQVFAQKTMAIGSSSMQPTFAKADQITINLFAYAMSSPARWDVVTYQNAANGLFWTHRVVGLPGDTISYDRKKLLRINGTAVNLALVDTIAPTERSKQKVEVFVETLGNERHFIQLLEGNPAVHKSAVAEFPSREQCKFENGGFNCLVPQKHYFVMGDNRDMSEDSRYLGFVPEEKIGGRVSNVPRFPLK